MYVALRERYSNVVLLEFGIYFIAHFTFYPRISKGVVGKEVYGKNQCGISKVLKKYKRLWVFEHLLLGRCHLFQNFGH